MAALIEKFVLWPTQYPEAVSSMTVLAVYRPVAAAAVVGTIAVPWFLFGNPLSLVSSGDYAGLAKFYCTAGVVFIGGMTAGGMGNTATKTVVQSGPSIAVGA